MSISGWLILSALGWQAVGAGMLGKRGYNKIQSARAQREYENYYAPVKRWWSRYGVSYAECLQFDNKYIGDEEFRVRVMSELRGSIETTDEYLLRLLSKHYIKDVLEREYIMALYYASKGRAARMNGTNGTFPSAGFFDSKPGVKQAALKLLEDNGVPETYWFCETEAAQRRRLDEIAHSY